MSIALGPDAPTAHDGLRTAWLKDDTVDRVVVRGAVPPHRPTLPGGVIEATGR